MSAQAARPLVLTVLSILLSSFGGPTCCRGAAEAGCFEAPHTDFPGCSDLESRCGYTCTSEWCAIDAEACRAGPCSSECDTCAAFYEGRVVAAALGRCEEPCQDNEDYRDPDGQPCSAWADFAGDCSAGVEERGLDSRDCLLYTSDAADE